jgi:hypothetical protein
VIDIKGSKPKIKSSTVSCNFSFPLQFYARSVAPNTLFVVVQQFQPYPNVFTSFFLDTNTGVCSSVASLFSDVQLTYLVIGMSNTNVFALTRLLESTGDFNLTTYDIAARDVVVNALDDSISYQQVFAF